MAFIDMENLSDVLRSFSPNEFEAPGFIHFLVANLIEIVWPLRIFMIT